MPVRDFTCDYVNPFTKKKFLGIDYRSFNPKNDPRPRIVLRPGRAELDAVTLRQTRFGGPAILPEQRAWPMGPAGPLTFIAHLDFAQIHRAHGQRLNLPASGALGVFFDVQRQPWGGEAGDHESLSLVYLDDPSTAAPRDSEADDPVPFRPLVLEYDPDGDEANVHQLGGAPAWIQGEARPQLQLLACGLPQTLPELEAREAEGVDVVGLLRRSAEWNVLLQIESDDRPFMWGDAGRLYIFIRDADLKALRFDQARHILQCF